MKKALERAEKSMDSDTFSSVLIRLNNIKMRVEDLVKLGEEDQQDLSETVSVKLQELKKKTEILIESSDAQKENLQGILASVLKAREEIAKSTRSSYCI